MVCIYGNVTRQAEKGEPTLPCGCVIEAPLTADFIIHALAAHGITEAQLKSTLLAGTCGHHRFESAVTVLRLTDGPGFNLIGFSAEVRVRCGDCGREFEWIGVPYGSSPMQPTASVDMQELRAPIRPRNWAEKIAVAKEAREGGRILREP